MTKPSYSFKVIEEKWQNIWSNNKAFITKNIVGKPKYYILEMFPYPSGKMHMGHVRNYTLGDVMARYKVAKGFNVLHPMGWDSFGLPAENAAKENNVHPFDWTHGNILEMKKHFLKLGFSIDWDKELMTCSPNYYKWEQEIFIEFLKHNIAYRKESWVNWDPVEQTVLANEQVVDGKGWRSGAVVEQKQLKQWFLKITDFAEDLLNDISLLENWPEKVKNMQVNWIGRSVGFSIGFPIVDSNDVIDVYSTKFHTIFGASFIGLSIYHPLTIELMGKNKEIRDFVKSVQSLGTIEENIANAEKNGIHSGVFVKNPCNGDVIPVFITNYVLDYAGGAVFGCPAHDERDYAFAIKYNLSIKQVIKNPQNDSLPYCLDDGVLINSGFLNNLNIQDAKEALGKFLIDNAYGKKTTNYRLKDWGVSRQRYWGTPIPVIYCNSCGMMPEKIENLPIELPKDVDFSLDGNPLDSHPTFKHINCPYCGSKATRETDTFDTFFESSWYFLYYANSHNEMFSEDSKSDISYWMPVDQYIGGIEHAVMHLLYSRFFLKALHRVNLIDNIREPFLNLMTQGMIAHKTYKTSNGWIFPDDVIEENGKLIDKHTKLPVVVGNSEKMSKSKKNVIDPSDICDIYGADTARLFVLSDSPPQRDLEWSDEGVESTYKFINKFWNFVFDYHRVDAGVFHIDKMSENDKKLYKYIQKALYNIENNINDFHFNKAIALCRELFNFLNDNKLSFMQNQPLFNYGIEILVQILGLFIPHICEEIWSKMKKDATLFETPFPEVRNEFLSVDVVNIAIQINGKTRGFIDVLPNISKDELLVEIMKIDNVSKHLLNHDIKKVIYVPNKIINLVV